MVFPPRLPQALLIRPGPGPVHLPGATVDDSSPYGKFRPTPGWKRIQGCKRAIARAASVLLLVAACPLAADPAQAAPAPANGPAITPGNLAYILKQIKIAEAHVRNTN